MLDQQRLEGDAYLAPFNGSTPELCLAHLFYSMHSYRSGGQSDVSIKRIGSLRKATPEEVDEHGRWRQQNVPGAERMALHYTQRPVLDRVAITLFCM